MLVYVVSPEIDAMTRRNVQAVLDNTTGEFELRVFYNGGKPLALPNDPRIVGIYYSTPMSIAAAYNRAFSCARGDTFACVHNDVEVPYGWNEALSAELEAGAGIAFPRPVEDAQECAARGIGTTQRGFPTGCCFMLSKALYERLGGFDEAFEECHFEDTDLWMRAVDAGERLGRADVSVQHGRGKTRTLIGDRCNGAFHRNRLVYADKHRREDGTVPIPTLGD